MQVYIRLVKKRREETHRRTEEQIGGIFCFYFTRVSALLFFHLFPYLQARRRYYHRQQYGCYSYQINDNNNESWKSNRNTKENRSQSTINILSLSLDYLSCHFTLDRLDKRIHANVFLSLISMLTRKKEKNIFFFKLLPILSLKLSRYVQNPTIKVTTGILMRM